MNVNLVTIQLTLKIENMEKAIIQMMESVIPLVILFLMGHIIIIREIISVSKQNAKILIIIDIEVMIYLNALTHVKTLNLLDIYMKKIFYVIIVFQL